MNKVKGRRTKERKGREKLELGAFLSGGVDLHSRGFRKIFCFSCSVFISLFFPPLSLAPLCGSLVCRAGLSHLHTVIHGVTGVHRGLTPRSWSQIQSQTRGCAQAAREAASLGLTLGKTLKDVFYFFVLHFFFYFPNNRAAEHQNKLF